MSLPVNTIEWIAYSFTTNFTTRCSPSYQIFRFNPNLKGVISFMEKNCHHAEAKILSIINNWHKAVWWVWYHWGDLVQYCKDMMTWLLKDGIPYLDQDHDYSTIVWFQKISIPPHGGFFGFHPLPPPPEFPFQGVVDETPHPPGVSIIFQHGPSTPWKKQITLYFTK